MGDIFGWGSGPDDAQRAAVELTDEKVQIMIKRDGLTQEEAAATLEFYKGAVGRQRGLGVAEHRIKLIQKVLNMWPK
ncbi:DUF4951 domain-containing protein [Labrys miyagiensis]